MTASSDPLVISTIPHLLPRPRESHKGTFGKVVVIAGSLGMSGAAVLAGTAALRSGAGLVQLVVPDSIASIVAVAQPCYMTTGLPADSSGRFSRLGLTTLLAQTEQGDAVVVGPGLGRSDDLTLLVNSVLEEVGVPVVLDADGLNALGADPESLKRRKAPFVLTPHPGEFARLIASDTRSVQTARQEGALAFASNHGGVLVLKGAGTLVTDGHRIYVNTTGNPGMATGGTGDVLAGMLGSLLAQGMDDFDAAILGVYLHGLAGDLACRVRGEVSLIATDLIDHLHEAFRTLGE